MRGARFGILGVVTLVLSLWPGTTATAGPGALTRFAHAQRRPDLPTPVTRCEITDERLGELSGLVSSGDTWFAVSDGGDSVRVFVVDPQTCSVRDVITSDINPYDVEDLEIDAQGRLWLADTGDNSLRRDTVAVHVVTRNQGAELFRLRYPDGPHDAEAMLLGPKGVPYMVTKDPFGAAGVYRPATELVAGATVPLERVGSVSVSPTRTPGGPLPGALGSVVFTGGAVSHDGSVVALRTYTDAYLYPLSDDGVPAALRATPLRVALPNEPQGEAVAFAPDGTLLSASEGREPVRVVPGAVAAVRARAPQPETTTPGSEPSSVPGEGPAASTAEHQDSDGGLPPSGALVTAGVLAAVVVGLATRLRRRRR